jgi:hypothetical protein
MRGQNEEVCNTLRHAPNSGRLRWPVKNAVSQNVSLVLGRMSGVQVSRHILFLLRCHFGGVRLARNAPRAKQGPRHVVFAQAGLAIVELSVAAVTWFHVWSCQVWSCWSPARGLFKGCAPEPGAHQQANFRLREAGYLPGRSSRPSMPAATLRPTLPSTLTGCSAMDLFEPPTRTLAPRPRPTVALPSTPA